MANNSVPSCLCDGTQHFGQRCETPCSSCAPPTYAAAACTSRLDTTCHSWSPSCELAGQFETAPPTATSDRQCANCSTCVPPLVALANCSAHADTVCGSCPCQHGGRCRSNTPPHTCDCAVGFAGALCETKLGCQDDVCLNGATCTPETPSCRDFCAQPLQACQNNADCQKGYLCLLVPLQDPACDDECVSSCAFQVSTAQGRSLLQAAQQCLLQDCLLSVGQRNFTCECAPGYDGPDCRTNINECLPVNPCKNNGTCRDGVASFECDCPIRYTGPSCEEPVTCQALPCLNGGTCIDTYKPFEGCSAHCKPQLDDCRGNNDCRKSVPCLQVPLVDPAMCNRTCLDECTAHLTTTATGLQLLAAASQCIFDGCPVAEAASAQPAGYQCSCPVTHSGEWCQQLTGRAEAFVPELAVTGAGFVLGALQADGDDELRAQGLAGFVLNGVVGQASGRATARLGSLSASSAAFTATRQPAATVTAAVASSGHVWHDARQVTVAVQVQDARGSAQATGNRVQLQASRTLGGQPVTTTGACTTSSSTGQCTGQLTLPLAWFADDSDNVRVAYGLAGASTLQPAALLVVHPEPAVAVVQDVVMVLPFKDLARNSVELVDVLGHVGKAISTFTLRFTAGPGLEIVEILTDGKWQATRERVSAQQWGIQALLAKPEEAPTGNVAAETLCQVRVRVLGTAALDATHQLNCTVDEVADINSSPLSPHGTPTPTQATLVDRFGQNTAAGGRVYVAREQLAGVVGYAEQSELVNTAALGGPAVATDLVLTGAYSTGSVRQVTTGLSCSLDSAQVAALSSSCRTLTVTSTQTQEYAAMVTLGAGSHSVQLPVRVWQPELPLTLTAATACCRPWPDGWTPRRPAGRSTSGRS